MLRLKCLVKRKEALRGRNLSRDSQVEGAPMVHPTSDVHVASEVVFCAPIGHLRDASENPNVGSAKTVEVATSVHLDWSLFGFVSWAESYLPSSVAEARRRGG